MESHKNYSTKATLLGTPKGDQSTAEDSSVVTPFFISPVAAGFPSPAEDYRGQDLNLHEFLVHNPAATFFVRASGDSMVKAGIHDGDLLVIDRSLPAEHGAVVIAAVAGELTVKHLVLKAGRAYLAPANDQFEPIDITGSEDTVIWGVVTHSVHSMIKPKNGL